MYRSLGLERDPFSLDYDTALYLETRTRTSKRRQALKIIEGGGSLWIGGPLGSGRQAFALDLAQRLAEAGRPTVVAWGPAPRTDAELLELLHRNLCDTQVPGSLIAICEEVYEKLLDGLWRGGSVVMFPAVAPMGAGAAQEAALLREVDFLGCPAAQLVLCGQGVPILTGLEVVELEPFRAEEIAAILRHRCLVSGGADALGKGEIDRIAALSDGVGDGIWRGAEALRRKAFKLPSSASPEKEEAVPPRSVLDKEAISEVGQLLSALTSRKTKR